MMVLIIKLKTEINRIETNTQMKPNGIQNLCFKTINKAIKPYPN